MDSLQMHQYQQKEIHRIMEDLASKIAKLTNFKNNLL